MRGLYVLLTLLFIACDQPNNFAEDARPSAEAAPSLTCPTVRSSVPLTTGQVLTGNLRNITVDNGIVRIRYGAHAMDFRDTGVTVENNERHMDHVLAARHTDDPAVDPAQGCTAGSCHDGTHWHDVNYSWYGDGIQYSSGAPTADADRMRVIYAGDDAIELAYEWDEVRLDGLRSTGSCMLGVYPECGPTDRDSVGAPVWKSTSTDTVKSVKFVKVWKTVRVERCSPGYYVSLRSNPPLVWPEQGTRAARIGYVTTSVAWSCDATHVARHPQAGQHVQLGTGDCLADISQDQDGHDGWPFTRFMLLREPTALSSLQYAPTQLGSPGAAEMLDTPGPDGRPWPWQAFIGAAEYVSPDQTVEPTTTARALLQTKIDQVRASVRW